MTTKEKSWLSLRKLGSSGSNFEVDSSQVHRQEKVNLATKKLGQRDHTRAKSEDNSLCAGKLDAVSPEMENMRFSDHHYMEKIILQNQCNDTENVLGIVTESRHPPWAGNLQEHKIREHRECVQRHAINKRTF